MGAHLTAGQKALLGAALEQRRNQLRRRLSDHHEGETRVDHAREVLQQDADDAPQRDADREVDLALSDIEARELGAVEDALARLQQVDFGVCADCGDGIAFDRLKLEPWALRCVACESRHEGYQAPTARL